MSTKMDLMKCQDLIDCQFIRSGIMCICTGSYVAFDYVFNTGYMYIVRHLDICYVSI